MSPFDADAPDDGVEILPASPGAENTLARAHEAGAMDIQVATAQRIGRDLKVFKATLEQFACSDPEIAEECQYVLKKGGSPIVGPSIRFAELIMSTYRHIVVDSFIESEERGYVVVGAQARDLYANTGVRVRVRRNVLRRDGTRYGVDQIQTTMQAGQSIAIRNAIIRLVPKALWLPIWRKAREVALGNAQPHVEVVERMFQTLARFHITEEQVCEHFEIGSREEIHADHIIQARNALRSMKSGELDPKDAFPPPAPDRMSAKQAAATSVERIESLGKEPASAPEKAAPAKATRKAPEPENASEGEAEDVEVEL